MAYGHGGAGGPGDREPGDRRSPAGGDAGARSGGGAAASAGDGATARALLQQLIDAVASLRRDQEQLATVIAAAQIPASRDELARVAARVGQSADALAKAAASPALTLTEASLRAMVRGAVAGELAPAHARERQSADERGQLAAVLDRAAAVIEAQRGLARRAYGAAGVVAGVFASTLFLAWAPGVLGAFHGGRAELAAHVMGSSLNGAGIELLKASDPDNYRRTATLVGSMSIVGNRETLQGCVDRARAQEGPSRPVSCPIQIAPLETLSRAFDAEIVRRATVAARAATPAPEAAGTRQGGEGAGTTVAGIS